MHAEKWPPLTPSARRALLEHVGFIDRALAGDGGE
jgi:hypothetical protein